MRTPLPRALDAAIGAVDLRPAGFGPGLVAELLRQTDEAERILAEVESSSPRVRDDHVTHSAPCWIVNRPGVDGVGVTIETVARGDGAEHRLSIISRRNQSMATLTMRDPPKEMVVKDPDGAIAACRTTMRAWRIVLARVGAMDDAATDASSAGSRSDGSPGGALHCAAVVCAAAAAADPSLGAVRVQVEAPTPWSPLRVRVVGPTWPPKRLDPAAIHPALARLPARLLPTGFRTDDSATAELTVSEVVVDCASVDPMAVMRAVRVLEALP